MNALANPIHHHVSVFSLSVGAPLCREEGLAGLISLFPEPCAGGWGHAGVLGASVCSGAGAFPAGLLSPAPRSPMLSPTAGFIQAHSLTLRDRTVCLEKNGLTLSSVCLQIVVDNLPDIPFGVGSLASSGGWGAGAVPARVFLKRLVEMEMLIPSLGKR